MSEDRFTYQHVVEISVQRPLSLPLHKKIGACLNSFYQALSPPPQKAGDKASVQCTCVGHYVSIQYYDSLRVFLSVTVCVCVRGVCVFCMTLSYLIYGLLALDKYLLHTFM